MRHTVNLLHAADDPVEWARRREDEGWDAISVADHVFTGTHQYPHVWVSATAMAMATSRIRISTAFVNNLFRGPVEVAHAALQLSVVSGGRFELGLGAGWASDEVTGSGLRYPDPPERAGRFAESAAIVRSLLHDGSCRFRGEYYEIDVPAIGPRPDTPPPLIAAVGGPRTIREVTPHVDRIELKAQSAATKGGALDVAKMATVTDDHLLDLIERVRAVRPDVELSLFVLVGAGDDPRTVAMRDAMTSGGGLFQRFFGAPEHVAEGLAWLETIGITRASLSAVSPDTIEKLAPHAV
ncbi:MAG: LLM class flavin-dependent oxidoreductase [Actinomycetota bacterium]